MSEVVVRERGPLARIGLTSGPEPRAPNLTPYLLAAPLILFMIAFYILPVVAMLMRSVSDPSWTLQHYAALPDDVVFLKTFANTFYTSLIVTLASLLLGYPVALALVRAPRWAPIILVLIMDFIRTSSLGVSLVMASPMPGSTKPSVAVATSFPASGKL